KGESLADITAGHTAINGKSIISRHKYGKGEVILLGAMSDEAGYRKLCSIALEDAKIECAKTEGMIVVIPRKGENAKGMIVIEADNQDGEIELDGRMTDLLTGNVYEGKMKIAPYGVYVLKA
ncbi:MAG: Beta-galactosidase C-terminal domain, partial [Clostridia bacterium]|nr:Beta-galactosidase C-terminal domain [Clostridia bacterium]